MPKLLLTNEVIATSLWKLLETNPAYSTDVTTKATVGKSAACTYFRFIPGTTNSTSGDFPDISLAKTGWRTESTLLGRFQAGTWTFKVALQNDTKYGFSVKVAARVSKSSNSNGSNATLIAVSESPNVIALPATAGGVVTDTWTWSAPEIVMLNQYLFVEYRIHIEVAATNASAQCSFICDEDPATRDESVTTSTFIQGTTYYKTLSENIVPSDNFSYVYYVGRGWSLFKDIIDITDTSKSSVWYTRSVQAYVAVNARAVAIKAVNTTGLIQVYGVRPVGNTQIDSKRFANDIDAYGLSYAIVKLDSSYQIELYGMGTAVRYYLVGYCDSDIGFVSGVNKTIGASDWVDVSNSEVPEGSTGVVYYRVNGYPSGAQKLQVRPKGSTTDFYDYSNMVRTSMDWLFIPVDANMYSQQKTNGYPSLYLFGSLGLDFYGFTNAINITPTGRNQYVVVDLSNYVPVRTKGVIIQVIAKTNYTGVDVRAYGSTSQTIGYMAPYSHLYVITCIHDRKIEVYLTASDAEVYLWGYFYKPFYSYEQQCTETSYISDLTIKTLKNPTPLTFYDKYVVTSGTRATTTSTTLVDDPYASKSFSLDSKKVVLVIYQVNSATMSGNPGDSIMRNAIQIDGNDVAISSDYALCANGYLYCYRNCVFWVGELDAGNHTIKGRFCKEFTSSYDAIIDNRILLIYILNGNLYAYADTTGLNQTSSTSFINDKEIYMYQVPASTVLLLYNCTNDINHSDTHGIGRKVCLNVNGTDYARVDSAPGSWCVHSTFTAHAIQTTGYDQLRLTGRVASNYSNTIYITRRQIAILVFDSSTLLDISTSTTRVSTSSTTPVDDTQAIFTRNLTDRREVLVVAVGTAYYSTYDDPSGIRYGIMVDDSDVAYSRDSGCYMGARSAATAYAIRLESGSHTIKGRFASNLAYTSYIDARQFIILWLSVGVAYSQTLTETLLNTDSISILRMKILLETQQLIDSIIKYSYRYITDTTTLVDNAIKAPYKSLSDTLLLSDVISTILLYYKTLFEQLLTSDIIIKGTNITKQDATLIYDSILKKSYKQLSDTILTADFVTTIKLYVAVLIESILINDIIRKLISTTKQDTILTSDRIIKALSTTKSDILSAIDNLLKYTFVTRYDEFNIQDIISKLPKITKVESILTSDYITKGVVKVVTDSIIIGDVIRKLIATIKSDEINLSDALTILKVLSVMLLDDITLLDLIYKNAVTIKSDQLVTSDLMYRFTSITKADSIYLSYALTVLKTLTKVLYDYVTMLDLLTKNISISKAEVLTVSDVLEKIVSIIKSDQLSISDMLSKLMSITKVEQVNLTDNLSVLKVLIKVLYDTTILADYIELTTAIPRIILSDSLAIYDNIFKLRVKILSRLLSSVREKLSRREKDAERVLKGVN